MTTKEKQFLSKLLSHSPILTALSYEYAEDDECGFKESYGISFKQAEAIVKKFQSSLTK